MGVRTSLLAITPAAASQTQGYNTPGYDDVKGNYAIAMLKLEEAIILLTRCYSVMNAASDANASAVNTQITALS